MSPATPAGGDPRSVGERLAAARERAGLSQERVAEQLRIAAGIIAALEAGDYSGIGPQVFVRGYLRRYAELVGEPPEAIAQATELHNWGDPTADITSTRLRPLAGTSDQRSIGPWPVLVVAFLLVVAAVVWWAQRAPAPRAAAGRAAPSQQALVQEMVVAPPTLVDGAPQAPAATDASATAGTAAPAAAPTAAPAPVAAPVAGSPAVPAAALPAPTPPKPAPKRAPPAAAPAAVPSAAPAAAPPTGATNTGGAPTPGTAPGPAGGPRRQLQLAFRGDSWAEVYDAAGRRLYWDLGHSGQAEVLAGTPPFKVTLGNPAVVGLAIEGQSLALPPPRVGTTLHVMVEGDGALVAVR